MSDRHKPDAVAIRAILSELDSIPDRARRWWPRYLYHSTRIENAAGILDHGKLLSRSRCSSDGRNFDDAAAPAIIGGLGDDEKRYVRLYFRPRAPTQFANEGIRPPHRIQYGAHMPVPVYFLFSAEELLTERGTCFTRGRLVRGAEMGDDATFLRSIPFRKVYHDGPFAARDRDAIIDARHAEVLIEDQLPLETSLRWIVCRSKPEADTLLHRLRPETRRRWSSRVRLASGRPVFFMRGTHVENVRLSPTKCALRLFSDVDAGFEGPFDLEIEWRSPGIDPLRNQRAEYFVSGSPYVCELGAELASYVVSVRLNGDLAYEGCFRLTAPTSLF